MPSNGDSFVQPEYVSLKFSGITSLSINVQFFFFFYLSRCFCTYSSMMRFLIDVDAVVFFDVMQFYNHRLIVKDEKNNNKHEDSRADRL